MVIYSGFSTRRQQQRYNHLTKQLLHLLNQIIITYVESTKLSVFKPSYEKLIFEISKMDQHKYSDLKISMQVDLLTQHIVNQQNMIDSFVESHKPKSQTKHHFRMKRNERNVQSANSKHRQRRSLSLSHDKKLSRHTISETQGIREPTMQELMKMHPLIQRKMTHIRKKRYIHPQPNNFMSNNFPQIQQQEEDIDEHQ